MKTWVNGSKGNPAYGLGPDYTLFQGEVAYGHRINLGTITDSPIHKEAEKSIDKFYEVFL